MEAEKLTDLVNHYRDRADRLEIMMDLLEMIEEGGGTVTLVVPSDSRVFNVIVGMEEPTEEMISLCGMSRTDDIVWDHETDTYKLDMSIDHSHF